MGKGIRHRVGEKHRAQGGELRFGQQVFQFLPFEYGLIVFHSVASFGFCYPYYPSAS